MSNENKVLLGVGTVGLLGLAYLYWKKKQLENKESEQPSQPSQPLNAIPKTVVTVIDRNKLLHKGSKGIEVRELQGLLDVPVDGDFGNITLYALQKEKGVSQITLNQFQSRSLVVKPVVAPIKKSIVSPKVGAKLMVIVTKATLYRSKKIANGSYSNTSKAVWGQLNYGESAGTFKSTTINGMYLVQKDGNYYFINGNNVTPY